MSRLRMAHRKRQVERSSATTEQTNEGQLLGVISHAQETRLRLILMVATTLLLSREYAKIYYRNDPVKYDLA